jgi:hypothetical protein
MSAVDSKEFVNDFVKNSPDLRNLDLVKKVVLRREVSENDMPPMQESVAEAMT